MAASPDFAEQGSSGMQEGSAGGQRQVPGVHELRPARSPVATEGRNLQQAPPDLQYQGPVPLGVTEERQTAKDRIERGEVGSTTKPVAKERSQLKQ